MQNGGVFDGGPCARCGLWFFGWEISAEEFGGVPVPSLKLEGVGGPGQARG